jgi:signal transduction histidine kinase
MKKISLIIFFVSITFVLFSQIVSTDTLFQDSIKIKELTKKKNFIINKQSQQEAFWDNGIPIMPEDENVMGLITELNEDAIKDVNKLTKDQVRIYRELGLEFYNKGMYEEADFYLSKIKNYTETKHVKLKEVFKEDNSETIKKIKEDLQQQYETKLEELKKVELSPSEKQEVEKDKEFNKSIPTKIDELSKEDLENLSQKIQNQINKLTKERDDLIKNKGSQELIDLKNTNIKTLTTEKEVVDLSINNEELKEEKSVVTRWLWIAGISILILTLSILALLQRKTIKVQDVELENQFRDISRKNTYLEHAAKIIRHDIHSGINTYIPRGITSLEKRLTPEDIKNLKLELPLKMIKDGLNHTQRVYKSVYEFTNLVKQNVVLEKKEVDLKEILTKYLSNTSYSNQVVIHDLITAKVNETLFCNAVDNLIRNGLKYNNSIDKEVVIFMKDNQLVIEDNGIGFSQEQLDEVLKSKKNKKDDTGLGLSICVAILNEHKFKLSCEKINTGTKMKIKIK